jgi:hypothetical protein
MRFFEESMISKYMKGVLSMSNIPTCKIWKKGRQVIKGMNYIYKNAVVNAVKSGVPHEHDEVDRNGYMYPQSQLTDAYLNVIRDYYWGDSIHEITVKYISKESYWSRLDQWYLGMYLRTMRDLFGIDYMWTFNCWDGDTFNASLERVGQSVYIKKDRKPGLKILTANIMPNQDYTIFIDSPTEVLMCAGFRENNRFISDSTPYWQEAVGSMRITQPKLLNIKIEESSDTDHVREYLTLMIQVTEKNRRVFVIEGDFSHYARSVERGTPVELPPNEIDEWNPNDNIDLGIESELSEGIAFHDRLFEYFSEHIINSRQFGQSIKDVQHIITSEQFRHANNGVKYNTNAPGNILTDGIWSHNMQRFIKNTFSHSVNNEPRVRRQNGEVNKDIERILWGIKDGRVR